MTIKQNLTTLNQYNYREGYLFIVFHTTGGATSAWNVSEWFRDPRAQGAAHYTVGYRGDIVQSVIEEHAAWACSDHWANMNSISIECCDDGKPWDSTRTDILYNAAAELAADIVQRRMNGVKLVEGTTVRRHNEFVTKDCPAGLDIQRLIRQTNLLLGYSMTEQHKHQLYEALMRDKARDTALFQLYTVDTIDQWWNAFGEKEAYFRLGVLGRADVFNDTTLKNEELLVWYINDGSKETYKNADNTFWYGHLAPDTCQKQIQSNNEDIISYIKNKS